MANVRVSIMDPNGTKKTLVEVPNNIPSQRLLTALVSRMGLPQVGPNGRPMAYRLTYAREGEETEMNPNQSFSDAGIEDDDVLRLYADMQAGVADETTRGRLAGRAHLPAC